MTAADEPLCVFVCMYVFYFSWFAGKGCGMGPRLLSIQECVYTVRIK